MPFPRPLFDDSLIGGRFRGKQARLPGGRNAIAAASPTELATARRRVQCESKTGIRRSRSTPAVAPPSTKSRNLEWPYPPMMRS